ncbi:unnamed protein product [Trypanosoma congolense IL3000]|uniref:WGS project CAEQ00000000 data, annotated contig 949 n=1 Tax=Trypanosoma congolense (strain IL3000) TaxID=1068625 RepID=F9WJU0_TRYCI|nr:unnamed protein product [Trypanosoma congolense IL3000]
MRTEVNSFIYFYSTLLLLWFLHVCLVRLRSLLVIHCDGSDLRTSNGRGTGMGKQKRAGRKVSRRNVKARKRGKEKCCFFLRNAITLHGVLAAHCVAIFFFHGSLLRGVHVLSVRLACMNMCCRGLDCMVAMGGHGGEVTNGGEMEGKKDARGVTQRIGCFDYI